MFFSSHFQSQEYISLKIRKNRHKNPSLRHASLQLDNGLGLAHQVTEFCAQG
jgi:hypothetical protein